MFAVVVVLGSGVQIEWLTVENSPASVQETFAAVRHGVDGQALTGIGSSHVVDVPLGLFLHPFHFDNLPESRLATEASTEVSDTVPVFRFVGFAIKYDNLLPGEFLPESFSKSGNRWVWLNNEENPISSADYHKVIYRPVKTR